MITQIVSRDATALPVTVESVKEYLRVEGNENDNVIESLIRVNLGIAESKMGRFTSPVTINCYLDAFPASTNEVIKLPYPPITPTGTTSVSITYIKDGTAGSTSTWAATAYTVDNVSQPARIFPTYDNSYPTDVRLQKNAIKISFQCGYVSSALPEEIKHWVRFRVAQGYEIRNPVIEGKSVENVKRDFLDGLLDPYILPEVY